MLRVTKKFFRILNKHQQTRVFILGIMMLFGGIMESLSVSLMLPLITAVMNEETWDTTWYAQMICGLFHIDDQRVYIEILLVALIVIFGFKNIYLLFEYFIQFSFIAKSRIHMQQQLMHSFLHKPYEYYLNSSSGEIVRIISTDTVQTFALLTSVLSFYTEVIVSIVLAITILVMSPQISIGLIIILGIELFVIAAIIKPIMKRVGIRYRTESTASNKWLLQGINGIKSIKVANTENFFEAKYAEHSDMVADAERKNQTLGNMPRLLIEAFTITGVMAMLFIMVAMGAELASIVPQLSAFVVAAVRLLPSVNRISSAMNQVPFYEGGLDNIIRTLEAENLSDSVNDTTKKISVKDKKITYNRKLEFQNITFGYPNGEKKIFDKASFEILPGQSIGIIGSSGSGKTTAVDIMLGLLSPQLGKIVVDGINIAENMDAWLAHLAYIPQTIFLMDDTIKANVAFGKHTNEISEEQVWNALRDAQMEEFVKSLPDGINTYVGEAGVRLSGGQRQRIGIARALYNNPDILFFDEATSALDNETEAAIMESINNLKGNKTLVIIAHRLTTIENCDVVYRVENGKVVRENF